ncbi:MAG: cation diffusion facilitator family transporter [Mogibacterium sp.]|nr:cation diffusion facilitator family transporter [Mogibacterium sp.]
MNDQQQRQKVIVRTSLIGIAVNVLLAAFKAAVGLLSNSIAVILDAVNNLSDALSSVITIIGAKLAGRKPDNDHPLGHGRIEYISALIVAAIVMYAGITSLIESVKKIIDPQKPDYSTISLVIIGVAVLAKILLGRYVKKTGEKTRSGALAASGTDALSDAALSLAVLLTALLYTFKGISLEAYVGVVISGFIIKAGYEMISDTVKDILGRRANVEVSNRIKEILSEDPDVLGAYDLFIHDYGPDKAYASVHVELPDNMTVDKVDVLTRKLTDRVYRETGVILTGVGVYSRNTDAKAERIRRDIEKIVLAHEWALQMHGFYIDEERKIIRFDVVMSFDVSHSEGIKTICEEVKGIYPEYDLVIVPDIDITD